MLIDRKFSLDRVNEPQVFDQKFIYNTKVPLKAAKMPLPSRQLKKTVTENDARKSLDNDFFVLFTIVTGMARSSVFIEILEVFPHCNLTNSFE